MSYEEAFKIGSVCDGYVKCTYAELFDGTQKELPGGNRIFRKLFSLQKRFAAAEHTIGATIGLNYEYPIVTTDTYFPNAKYVPVYLTDEAAEYINHIISLGKKREEIKIWQVVRVYDHNYVPGDHIVNYAGERFVVYEGTEEPDMSKYTDDGFSHYEKIQAGSKWAELAGLVKAGDTFNVKVCAIDWMPTKIDNVFITETDKNGNTREVKLDDVLEAARKKMENAKALLLASGGTLLF